MTLNRCRSFVAGGRVRAIFHHFSGMVTDGGDADGGLRGGTVFTNVILGLNLSTFGVAGVKCQKIRG